MRDDPLLLVLDEPTAALDAETEHALFERYAAVARGGTRRITILVSHRFSTVRMADQIVVLDGARVVESGTHEALLAKGGQYAELYRLQAAACRGGMRQGDASWPSGKAARAFLRWRVRPSRWIKLPSREALRSSRG